MFGGLIKSVVKPISKITGMGGTIPLAGVPGASMLGTIGTIGSALSPLLGIGGTYLSNRYQVSSAQDQMRFQKAMSDTSYQRVVKDMRRAGINPMLAVSKGGASTPSGAQANIKDYGVHAATALQLRRMAEDVKNLAAQRKFTEAQTLTEENKPENLLVERQHKQQLITNLRQNAKKIIQETKNLKEAEWKIKAEYQLTNAQWQQLEHLMPEYEVRGNWYKTKDAQLVYNIIRVKEATGESPYGILKDIVQLGGAVLGGAFAAKYLGRKAAQTGMSIKHRNLKLKAVLDKLKRDIRGN